MPPTRPPHELNNVAGSVRRGAASGSTIYVTPRDTAPRRQLPLKAVIERFGHNTIMLTADTYVHVTAKMQEDAAQRLDGAFRGIQ
jgi:hypothetical protein